MPARMKPICNFARGMRVCLTLLIGLAGAASPVWAGPEEPGLTALWRIHEKHRDGSKSHAEIVAQAEQYVAYFPDSPYVPVAKGIAAWHLLKIGQTPAAVSNLNAMLTDKTEPVAMAGDLMAKRWLTRLDRERVVRALHDYFSDHVAFPETIHALGSLPATNRPPLVDRWGRVWRYSLTAFPHMPKIRKQRFILECTELDPMSDLTKALQLPYGSRINLKPVSVMAAIPGMASVLFETTDAKPEKAVLTENAMFQRRITFVKITPSFVLMTDGDHWSLSPRPNR